MKYVIELEMKFLYIDKKLNILLYLLFFITIIFLNNFRFLYILKYNNIVLGKQTATTITTKIIDVDPIQYFKPLYIQAQIILILLNKTLMRKIKKFLTIG